jgi:predicted AlkP superfamily phosphohydrolase/phosphomutase
MKKVLMIGLDGATFTLLKPMMDDGVMPYLKAFMQQGVHGDLMSTRNPLTPPAWTTMITGVPPEEHGIHDFLRPSTTDAGGVYLSINDARHNRAETIWSMASRQGRRTTSLNFYGMNPPPENDGYIASGFVPWKHLRKAVSPPEFFEELKAMDDFDYKLLGMDIGEEKKCLQGLEEGEQDNWIALQNIRDRAWADLCCMLMKKDRTDLTAVVLDGPDKMQHLFWRYVDPALLPENPSAAFTDIRNQCLDFYRGVDDNIKRLCAAAGDDTNVIITSDHGFGETTEVVYLNEWLARRGYLVWKQDAADGSSGQLTSAKMKDHLSMIDWQKTTAYCPTPSSNAIYIKKARGESHGVRPEEYMDFCISLKKDLLDYRDPANNEPVFTGVVMYKLEGEPFVEPAPDMTVTLRDGGFVSILKSSDVVVPREFSDGTHRPNGIFIGRGPDIGVDQYIDPINISDITPLMLYLMGLPVPRNLSGRVPTEALQDGSGTVESGGNTVASGSSSADKGEPTQEERDALIRQMKVLGYME